MMEMVLHPMFVSLMVDSVPAELITADGNVTCALTDSTTTQTVTVYINTIEFTLCYILTHNSNRILIASFFIFKHAIVISKDLYPKFATKIAENVCAKMDLMVEM